MYLDHIIPDFDEYLITNSNQEPIFPSGSGRNVFLNVDEDKKEILIEILKNKLGDKNGCCEDLAKSWDFGNLDAYNEIEKHCKYFRHCLKMLPNPYTDTEANRN